MKRKAYVTIHVDTAKKRDVHILELDNPSAKDLVKHLEDQWSIIGVTAVRVTFRPTTIAVVED